MLVIVLLTISASVMYSSSESAYKLNTLFSVSIENFPLRNLEFDEQTSSYYVSGKNILYKFDTRSSIPTEKVVTGPNYGCATDTEMSKEFRSDDENSVMVVTTDYIVTCGTLYGGECLRREKKTLRNRNRLKVYLVNNNTVSALGKFITITLRGEKHLRKVLLFAKPFSKIYSSMFERKVIFSAYTELVGNLTTRNEIDTFDLILKEPGTNTNLNYRSMFENDDFVFILFNQNSGAKLAKLCKSIEGENSKLPYEEIPISCYDERKNFTTAVHGKFVMQLGTRYLAAVFSNSEETFALCLFSETELYNAFLSSRRQRFGCPSQDLPPSDMIYEDVMNLGQCINISSGYDDEPFPGAYDIVNRGDFCNNVTNLESHFRIIIGVLPLHGTAVYKTQTKIRMIGDQVENGFVLLYLGTDQGSIVKTYLDETLQVHYIERIRIDNSRIQAITNINGVPIVMTEYKIVNITSKGCENFSESCKDCMRAKSAQCGWCLSTQRCTERLACNNVSNLWLSSLKNHCLKIHLNIDSIEVDLHQKTNVTVTFIPTAEATRNMTCILNVTSLPSLQEKGKLKCLIDLSAMKIGGHSVEPGKKELKVSLDGNVIAVTDILFYRCEDIKSCWRCTGNKKIRCFWCLLDAMCSNTRVKCSNMHGVDELEDRNCNDVVQMEVCPMILNSTQRISSGSIHNISFQGRHLPSKLTYQCLIGDKIFKSSWDNITNSLICENIKSEMGCPMWHISSQCRGTLWDWMLYGLTGF